MEWLSDDLLEVYTMDGDLLYLNENGDVIEYAEQRMQDYHSLCRQFIDEKVKEKAISDALTAYIDFVIERKNWSLTKPSQREGCV